jgi:hypothetical protein
MKTKLTLRIDVELIDRAKAVARKRETSVSKLVADYLRLLDTSDDSDVPASAARDTPLPGILSELHGCMRDGPLSESDYKAYLSEKHS